MQCVRCIIYDKEYLLCTQITLNNKVFANCTTIGGLNQFWDAESRSETRFSPSNRVFD